MATKWPSNEWPIPDATPDMHWTAFETPDAWAQIMYAQATFTEFARCADLERFRIVPTYDDIAIKAFFENPARPPFGEHIFLTDVFTDGKHITATLSASPNFPSDLRENQELTFPVGKLSDWFLVRAGKGVGGFTIPLIWNSISQAQRAAYRNEPPFIWFAHRAGVQPQDRASAHYVCYPKRCKNVGHRPSIFRARRAWKPESVTRRIGRP